jgi:hypothetical protein
MSYINRFIATDNLIIHLNTFVGSITDPSIQANYAGFLSVSSVTVYELAIKDIFNEFATKKNKVFGNFTETHFSRINGRIKLDDLKGTHIKLFGEKYLIRFNKNLKIRENAILSTVGKNITTDYGNLVTCRHKYVHGGSPTLTINEVISCYASGKEVIDCLHQSIRY